MATSGDFLPICEPALGWVFGCCRRGASHVHSNTPCQDAYGISTGSVAGSPYVAIAVADGHGDKKHDLSQFGAALAVQAALEEMRSQFLHFGCEPVPLVKHFRADFPRIVVERWRKAVLEDAKERLGEEPPPSKINPNAWEALRHHPACGAGDFGNHPGGADRGRRCSCRQTRRRVGVAVS